MTDFKPFVFFAGSLLGAALLASSAIAQDVPAENVGLSAEVLGEIDLAAEFDEVGARKFRMRLLTVEPGGAIGIHNHQNRPSVEYVLSGSATETRGGETTTLVAGDKIVADHTTEHYWRNENAEPLVILAVDIYEPQ